MGSIRILVKVWREKDTLMSFQIDLRDLLLETGGKAILVIKWQRIWAKSCLCLGVLGKADLANNDRRYLVKDILFYFYQNGSAVNSRNKQMWFKFQPGWLLLALSMEQTF